MANELFIQLSRLEYMIDVKLDIKPIPVPLLYQPVYKLVMLLAILKYGTSKPHNATFLKLHLYFWSLRSEENYSVLLQLKKKQRNSILPWSFEPALDKVVTIAIVNNYCTNEIKSTELQVKITSRGESFLQKIEDLELFCEDILRIKTIGNIPQTSIKSASSNWKLNF
jgi:predicted transcriptional regulator